MLAQEGRGIQLSGMNTLGTLEARERNTLNLLIEFVGDKQAIRFRTLRENHFPERLSAILGGRSEYLDSLCSREFQKLRDKGWLALDGTGKIEILHRP